MEFNQLWQLQGKRFGWVQFSWFSVMFKLSMRLYDHRMNWYIIVCFLSIHLLFILYTTFDVVDLSISVSKGRYSIRPKWEQQNAENSMKRKAKTERWQWKMIISEDSVKFNTQLSSSEIAAQFGFLMRSRWMMQQNELGRIVCCLNKPK